MKRKRKAGGQAMVEYALGIGCVAAVCMCVMAGLGHAGADIMNSVLKAVNDSDDQVGDPGYAVNKGASPWAPQ